VREWNFTLRGLGDRELLAAPSWPATREVWDRCINTSDRTRAEVDLSSASACRCASEVVAKAARIGLDPAYVYGLIRQESRFIMDARSRRRLGPDAADAGHREVDGAQDRPRLPAGMITDRDTNLRSARPT
jgi:soluble lytic murein transglycosylase